MEQRKEPQPDVRSRDSGGCQIEQHRTSSMKKEELQQEKAQVDARHSALAEQLRNPEFTRSLPGVQDGLLRRELGILEQYSLILGERINNFFDPVAGQKEGIAIPGDHPTPAEAQGDAQSDAGERMAASKQAQRSPDQDPQEQPQARQQRQQEQQQAPKAKQQPKRMAVRKTAPRMEVRATKVVSKSKK